MNIRRYANWAVLMGLTGVATLGGCSDDDEKLKKSCSGANCGGARATGGTNSGGVPSGGSSDGGTGEGGALSGGADSGGTSAGGANTAGSNSAGASVAGNSAAGSVGLAGRSGGAGVSTAAGAGGSAGQASTGGSAIAGSSALAGAGGVTNGGAAGDSGVAGAAAGAAPIAAILKYDFEDATGTKVTDLSGHGNNGTLSGATWSGAVEGRNGYGAVFASATQDNSVVMPNDLLSKAKAFTISAWVRLTDNQSGNRLFDIGSAPDNHVYLTFNNLNGGIEFGAAVAGNPPSLLYTSAMLPLNVWKHVAVSSSSAGTHLYVDGWEVAKSALAVDPSTLGHTTSDWIGKSQTQDPAFTGALDEFYVYDGALSRSEIVALAWPKTDYSIWHFDETDGTVAVDSSDNHRDATMVRATFASGVVSNAAQLYNPNNTDDVPPNDQYVQLPVGVVENCTQGFTVATWINIAATRAHARVFEFSNNTSNWVFGRIMGGSTQQWAFGDFTDASQHYANINLTWTTGTWYHVAAVRNGQVISVYLNGGTSGTAWQTTMPDTVPPVSSLGSTLYNYIGRTKDSAATGERRRFHGLVDEFLLSCRPYTADEIKLLAVRP